MITCPSCNHQNPEGSLQCENCYTPLPATTSCPNCGASVQTDATFCGQCGFNLQAENSPSAVGLEEETAIGSLPNLSQEEVSLPDELPLSRNNSEMLPETAMSSPIQSPWDDQDDDSQTIAQNSELPFGFPEVEQSAEPPETQFIQPVPISNQDLTPFPSDIPDLGLEGKTPESVFEPSANSQATGESIHKNQPPTPKASVPERNQPFSSAGMPGATQLQIQRASLLHLQSNTTIEIPSSLDVVHFGKPNGQIPPDIDVSGYPDSEVVSRVHADIRIEGDTYYVEDTGSSNGTYVNHAPLQKGNRHRLRTGDRIALGKGDLVTFIFQLS
ncbi:peptide-binding protein [Pleurocapsa sp. CCALA 161]|uniref:FHA domain-containing protein n=1 Tax=Pleurocapsa sp. CCALA 161 TaxID=2107688 RepID=UPI000D0833B7|nr:FHA domain-containing protein [Pleurocapsa sp. CCALA 161]PSB12013.1 peptide-binding protein [Pleurocapsa sp. CCALA 161]